MRIIYMGTPDFAVEPLRRLVGSGKEVVAVVTMPDKPAGRGHKIKFSPVKEFALMAGIPVLQPENLKSPDFIETLRSYNADLQIVVAFRMLPEIVWSMPPLGTFNLHASLLPQYRGAAPINWAVINGEKETGVTTFFLKHEIDTGNIIMQESITIEDNDNAGTIHDKLMYLGSDLVLKTVEQIENGSINSIPQAAIDALKPAPKIFKDTCRLSFDRSVADIHNHIRGLSPYPAAQIELTNAGGETIGMKIFESEIEKCSPKESAGTLVCDGKHILKVAAQDGYIHLTQVQLAGKKRMGAEELMRGTDLTKVKISDIKQTNA